MQGIIDRFEGDYAVVEFPNREMRNIPREQISPDAQEGNVIKLIQDKWKVDIEETQKRKQEIDNLTKGLWE